MAKVFLNDRLVDEQDAAVPANDGGLLYGSGLFETMRVCNHRVFMLEDHLDRLFSSAKRLGMGLEVERDFLADAIGQVLRANNLKDARCRLTVTSGSIYADDQVRRPTILVAATALETYPTAYYQKGIKVILCPYRQNPSDPLTGHKSTSYMARMLALRLAHQAGAAEALWFTPDGSLAEGCVSNVFLVCSGRLLTPPLSTPVLPGIARKVVARVASDQCMELTERRLTIDDLLSAEEVFLTNVIMRVMPVIAVERHTVADGKVGPVARQMLAGFDREIDRYCGKGHEGP
ncbi:MAG: aminotransferase class IV [Sedimentisphaerales bacterium]|jgi:branched-chain amino acid aminotransferase|nr:aminotransferase class IV [Sedimentisphaerales bacterium]